MDVGVGVTGVAVAVAGMGVEVGVGVEVAPSGTTDQFTTPSAYSPLYMRLLYRPAEKNKSVRDWRTRK